MKEMQEYTFDDFIEETDADILAFSFFEGICKKQFEIRKKEKDSENKKILYKYLINQLQQIKNIKEKNKEQLHTFTKPIYSDEDIEFLRQAIINSELTLYDLTWNEAMLLGVTGEQYRRLQRKVYCKMNFSKEEKKEFDKIAEHIHEDSETPSLINAIYEQVKAKKKK